MNYGKDNSPGTMALNAVSIAFVAILSTQVFHEASHAIAVILVGARLKAYNPLFAVDHDWVGEANRWGDLVIAGEAATPGLAWQLRWVMRRRAMRLL